ncbi:MAG: putative SapB synthase [Solirubrobacteraceae bacterium]|nr:putative SapB synthase [Solirubrobacteraceae bacterium]
MDDGYELYCLTDPVFYDSFILNGREERDYELAQGPVPEGWQRRASGDWLTYMPPDPVLPSQGWKIHASACMDNAAQVLGAVWEYCVARRIPFKFIRNERLLFLRNVKYAPRGVSGKFITLYPADDTQLEIVLRELATALEGQAGPYILSDLRCGAGPLYVRYGAFAERYCTAANGESEPAIADATGRLVPDRRGPTFSVPDWVTLPACLEPHVAARAAANVEQMPYKLDSALHFSNAGGLYAGVDVRSGERVVLKEARPHAGLTSGRVDAVVRLHRERDVLERLAGLDEVPRLHDFFTLGEHYFLVQELIEGTLLSELIAERQPLNRQDVDERALAEYASWVVDVSARVERAVSAIHDRGIVIGDLHPSNMIVREDGRVALFDWEVASDAADELRPALGAAGFIAPAGRTGLAVDRYALACLRFCMFMPLTPLFTLDPGKAPQLAAKIADTFPVPREFLEEAARIVVGDEAPGEPRRNGRRQPSIDADGAGWERARDSMARAILASATPDRDDRLFPGDIQQFRTGGLNIAHGAAGVLYALAQTGAGRHAEHEEWLVRRALEPQPETRMGLYDGLHGVAHVLDRLGRRGDALAVLDVCSRGLDGQLEELGLDLYGGLAGIGLNLAYFADATGDTSLWQDAHRVAGIVAERLGDADDVAPTSGGQHAYAGLTRGSSGPALLFLRLYEHTGHELFLDLAATALRQDLRRCIDRDDDGTLQVDEGWRTLPYVADGSVGIGFALDTYLAHRADESLAAYAPGIRRAAEVPFCIQPGLFYGRAGMILYLSRAHPPGTAAARDPVVASHVRRLEWHALSYRGHLAFPGERLLRLSMDLGSGSAGVMLALGAALHDEPVHLPLLGPLVAAGPPELPDRLILDSEGR